MNVCSKPFPEVVRFRPHDGLPATHSPHSALLRSEFRPQGEISLAGDSILSHSSKVAAHWKGYYSLVSPLISLIYIGVHRSSYE